MKISIYALHLGFGGVEKYVSTIANMLAKEHDVEIVSTYKLQDVPAFYVSPEVKIRYLIEDLKPNKENLKNAVREKRILSVFRELFRSVYILYLKRHRNITSLKSCKSDVIISTRVFHNRLIRKYADKSIVKITGEHNHHNNNKAYIKAVIESCKGFDYFIPISRELCMFYKSDMDRIGVKTRYIRFCIDDNPDMEKPPLTGKEMISVGRFSPEKDMQGLIRLFKKVHIKDKSIKLNIVGSGEEYDTVAEMIHKEGLDGYVTLHGFQDKKYIYELMKKMSLYVMTSFTESFGIVLLEAMSCGIPCVAFSSAQGAHEIIRNGYNGWLIDDRNHEKMIDKILRLMSSPDKLREYSENAFSTAEEFSYNNTECEWLTLMESIREKRRAKDDKSNDNIRYEAGSDKNGTTCKRIKNKRRD